MSEGVKRYANRTVVSDRPTTPSTGAYSANDLIGTLMEFDNVIQADMGGGLIHHVLVTDMANQTEALKILLFDTELSTGSNWATGDASALTLDDDDVENCIGIVDVDSASFVSAANNAVASVEVHLPFYITGRKLYGLVQAVGTPTYASDDLIVRIGIERDA